MSAKITASNDGLSGSLAVGANEAFQFKPVGGGLELSQDGIIFQTVDTNGKVAFPQGVNQYAKIGPVFSVRGSGAQNITANTWTSILFNAVEFDTTSAYTAATGKFQPTVAGFYQFNVAIQGSGASTLLAVGAGIYKNKTTGQVDYYAIWEAPTGGTKATDPAAFCSALVYLNGTTDYVTGAAYISGTGTCTVLANNATFLQGMLIGVEQ